MRKLGEKENGKSNLLAFYDLVRRIDLVNPG